MIFLEVSIVITFLISFLMIFISSYFLASVFEIKKFKTALIYLYLIAFAQIVLSIELLSLFNAISKVGILILNAIILVGSFFFWKKHGRPLYRPQVVNYVRKILNAIKKDKMLGFMGVGFLFFIAVSVVLCAIFPVIEYDSLSYHFNRALEWVSQGSLAHFDIADDRNINMAINSEVLYTWFLTFFPKNMFIRFFTFVDYIFALVVLSSFLEVNGFSMRKRLWSLFLFTSIAGVTVGASGVETNIMIGALALAGVTLFQVGVKKSLLSPLYFSSLAFALGVGAKTSIFFMLPAVAIILLYFIYQHQRKSFMRYLFVFVGFSILNFILFASYNYVLNFIEFGNMMGSAGTIFHHKMSGGVKGYISGLVRHLVLLLDFTGFSYGFYLEKFVFALQNKLLSILHIPLDLNVISGNENQLNVILNDSVVGGGVVGVFVLLPCAFVAIVRGILFNKSYKNRLLALLAVSIFVSIAVMSASIGFMKYSARFILSFLIFASPLFVISYIKSNKNIFKYIILFYVMSYFMVISTHIGARHFFKLINKYRQTHNITEVRNSFLCSTRMDLKGKMPFCVLRSELYKLPKGSKIALFPSHIDNTAIIKLMDFDGYVVDFLLLNKLHLYNLSDYDYIVFTSDKPISTYIQNPDEVIKNYRVENGVLVFNDKTRGECAITEERNKPLLVTQDTYKSKVPGLLVCTIPYETLDNNGFYKIGQIIYTEDEITKVMSIFKR